MSNDVNDNFACITQCPTGSVGFLSDRKCYASCPSGYVKYPNYDTCLCGLGTYMSTNPADNFACLSSCPLNYYKLLKQGKCYQNCPLGYDEDSIKWECTCQLGFYLTMNDPLNMNIPTCVQKCPVNEYGFDGSR